MPRSTTHVMENIDSMDRHPEHVALAGHGVEGKPTCEGMYDRGVLVAGRAD